MNETAAQSQDRAASKTSASRPIRAIAYPAIERHGVIGDRRTAALVAADGTLDWLCLPDYDGHIVFGAVLDWARGGFWRMGPVVLAHGEQVYEPETMVVRTEWTLDEGRVVLRDAMLWPEDCRAPEQEPCRVLLRTLACVEGRVRCGFDLRPGFDFADPPNVSFAKYPSGINMQVADLALRLWSNAALETDASGAHAEVELNEGEEVWATLELGSTGHGWSVESAREALENNRIYWRNWLKRIRPDFRETPAIRRSAMMIHLLTYAPEGSAVAAITTSLPEQIGGGWNADYRLSWIRDTSLALGILERLGDWEETERYLQWLNRRQSRFGQPVQVLYGIRGEKRPRQKKLSDASGYRDSVPVRAGNHAYKQFQIGSLGFLMDCIWLYLEAGGRWRDDYWKFLRRMADYTLKHWGDPDNGLWELPARYHFVYSRVLSWVTLDRAIRIAQKVNPEYDAGDWRAELSRIHDEVMEKGWSEKLGAFRQHYEADNLDSATLLISILGFLPGDHPRVLATIEKISRFLTIDDYTYRFDPRQTPGLGDDPLGQLEGAFLPCTFWLATAYAKASQPQKAESILRKVEHLSGPLGLFAEAVDPRCRCFLGNTPLLFPTSNTSGHEWRSHGPKPILPTCIGRTRKMRNPRTEGRAMSKAGCPRPSLRILCVLRMNHNRTAILRHEDCTRQTFACGIYGRDEEPHLCSRR